MPERAAFDVRAGFSSNRDAVGKDGGERQFFGSDQRSSARPGSREADMRFRALAQLAVKTQIPRPQNQRNR